MKKYMIHTIIFAALMGLSIASFVIGCFSGLVSQEQQYSFLSSLPYEYCYEFIGDDYPENSFIDLNSAYSAKAHGHTIKSDKLMQLCNVGNDIWPNVSILSPNEVYLSANLMRAHSLEVGDEISVQTPSNPESKNLRIVGELPACYGLYQDFTDTNRGVVLFGFDETFVKNSSANFITYQGNEFRPSEIEAQLVSLFSLQEQAHAIRLELVQTSAVLWCIILAADAIAIGYLYTMYRSYLQKLYYLGLGTVQTLTKVCYTMVSPLLLCRVIWSIIGLVLFLINLGYTLLLINLCELLLIIIIAFVITNRIERSA